MGKFSKPRKTAPGMEETVILPKVPAPEEPVSEAAVPQSEFDIPPAQDVPNGYDTAEEFDAFDAYSDSKKSRSKKIILVSICSVAAIALIGAIAAFWFLFGRDPNDHKILNNVYVAGINLGGMTVEEAENALRGATAQSYTQNDMVVELPDAILSFSPADTGAVLDVEAAVQAAYDYGRTGTREEKAAALENSKVTDHPIALLPYLNLNLDYIRGELQSYGSSFNSTYTPSSVLVEGDAPILDASDEKFDPEAPGQTLVLTMGTPGRYVDIEGIFNRVLDAYSFNLFLVQVTMDEEEKIPEAIDLEALYEEYYKEPVDAKLDEETFEVISEVYGYGFDLEAAQSRMEEAIYGDTVTLSLELIAPEQLGENMRELLFRDVLCEYKTEHTNNANRNTNLKLACEAINGTILYPGEEFDYNTVVGKRTTEKGYKAAGAYSSGKTVETIGGGICQVSSTIYYCCLVADLEIVNRLPHSYVSSYMPMGMDATVSWGGPEFTFKNNTNYPIRIETWVADGYVHCKLIGTDEKDYYIVMEYEVVGSQNYDTVYEEYPKDNKEGYKDGEVIQTPYRGYTVKTYKCKYDKETDELIIREFDRLSSYKNRDKIIAKIVKETEPEEEEEEDDKKDKDKDKETKPPKTEPEETKPPKTEPEETKPPKTEPEETDPPKTEPPETDPPKTEPPATEAPKPTDPPATEAPASQDEGNAASDNQDAAADSDPDSATEA